MMVLTQEKHLKPAWLTGFGTTAGKAIHLRVLADISDLSIYVGVANNGGGTDGIEITFNSISVSAGDDILVQEMIS